MKWKLLPTSGEANVNVSVTEARTNELQRRVHCNTNELQLYCITKDAVNAQDASTSEVLPAVVQARQVHEQSPG